MGWVCAVAVSQFFVKFQFCSVKLQRKAFLIPIPAMTAFKRRLGFHEFTINSSMEPLISQYLEENGVS